MIQENECADCFHYGKSCRTGKIECAIKDTTAHINGKCLEYVDLKKALHGRP